MKKNCLHATAADSKDSFYDKITFYLTSGKSLNKPAASLE